MSENKEKSTQKVVLASNDGSHIEVGTLAHYPLAVCNHDLTKIVDRAVAERSMLIKNLIEDLGDESISTSPIPIPNVNDPVLRKVVEWCEKHRGDSLQSAEEENDTRKKTTDIDEWDQKFMQVDQEMLFEIILVSCRSRGLSVIPWKLTSGRPPTILTLRHFSMLGARPWPT